MTDDFPALTPTKPLWLVTLADLALLLVGFLVLVHASGAPDGRALARGLRAGFGAIDAPVPPMPVAAAGMTNFAPGSATLPGSPDSLIAWAREATRDPRVTLTITGATDGSAGDVDAATGSAALLATDRARAVAAVLAPAVPRARLTVTTNPLPTLRTVMVTQAFAGPRP